MSLLKILNVFGQENRWNPESTSGIAPLANIIVHRRFRMQYSARQKILAARIEHVDFSTRVGYAG
jgi:hypothetical protein